MSATPQPTCVYCGGRETHPHLVASDIRSQVFEYYRCEDCRAVFIDPPPTDAVLRAAYDDSYYGEKNEKFSGAIERVLDSFRRRRARLAQRYLKRGDKVVDIGCGNGRFLRYLGELGPYQLAGIELPGKAAERAALVPGIQLKRGVLEPEDFPRGTVALVTLFHVFEHLRNPRETLAMIAAAVRPGGHVIASFPNIDSVQARLFRAHWLHLDPPRHLCFLGPTAFQRAAEAEGFEICQARYFSLEQNTFGFAQSLLNRCGLPRDLLYERLKGNSAYAPHHGPASVLAQKAVAAALTPAAILLDLVESLLKRGATVEFLLRRR